MSQIISEIHRISDAYSYVPVITETSGLIEIVEGVTIWGYNSVALKVQEYYMGQKIIIPLMLTDAAQFNAKIGKIVLMHGFKKIAPTTGALLTAYMLFGKYLTQ